MAFFVPSWINRNAVCLLVDGQIQPAVFEDSFLLWEGIPVAGMVFELNLPAQPRIVPVVNQQHDSAFGSIRLGPMILGVETDQEITLPNPLRLKPLNRGAFIVQGCAADEKETVLYPIGDTYRLTPENRRMQVLFKGIKSCSIDSA
jgi:hypothetical protein